VKKLIAFVLGVSLSLTACATATPREAVLASTVSLTQLEHGMAIYCERAVRDADVCAMARKVDMDAYAAVMAANAALAAGGDPSEQLAAADLAYKSLAAALAGVGVQ
jgi:hypothetical protein